MLWKNYSAEIENGLDYLATWLPDASINIGDVGYVRRRGFNMVGTLADHGVEIAVEPTGKIPLISHASSGAVVVEPGVAASADDAASGSVRISFKREEAMFFSALDCVLTRLKITATLIERLVTRWSEGLWDSDLAIVTEVMTAARTTVLISGSATASAKLTAGAGVAAATLGLTELTACARLSRTRDLALQIASAADIRPLYRVRRLHRSWSGRATFRSEEDLEAARIPSVRGMTLLPGGYQDDPSD